MKNAVAYARFSSDNQREESIDAQVRAIKYYATQCGYDIVKVYADRAKSGRTSDRPEFLKMIADSSQNNFEAVIVHKLDRFSRNSTDTLNFERELKINGVELVSVNERLDNSPEGALMKMIITGMNEFYSKNLAREVMKGLKENAYNCKSTGGRSPLGYDIGPDKSYVINEREAEAVRLIFNMYDNGQGYGEILDYLNSHGYKTKLGNSFGKSSMYDLLKNEKYTGAFIFNKSESKSAKGTFNRHKYKDPKEIIKIEDGIPAIIDKLLFERVNKRMAENKHKNAQHKAKTIYLLSGKLFCGQCGGAMTGETRRYRDYSYGYYICSNGKRTKQCNKKMVSKELLEQDIINYLNSTIFNADLIDTICSRIYDACQSNNGIPDRIVEYRKQMDSIDVKISNLCKAIEAGVNMEVATNRINILNEEKKDINFKIIELGSIPDAQNKNLKELKEYFKKNGDIKSLTPQSQKLVIDKFIEKIFVYDIDDGYKIRVILNPSKNSISDILDSKGNIPSPPNKWSY